MAASSPKRRQETTKQHGVILQKTVTAINKAGKIAYHTLNILIFFDILSNNLWQCKFINQYPYL